MKTQTKKAKNKREVAKSLCDCGLTQSPPVCDGAHKTKKSFKKENAQENNHKASKGTKQELHLKEESEMEQYKVKTFGIEIRPLKTMQELSDLDNMVNEFISENKIKKVISVSDSPTTNDKGEIIGLIRVLTYKV